MTSQTARRGEVPASPSSRGAIDASVFAAAANELGDEAFGRRFVLARRERERLASFFTLQLRESHRLFKNVHVDDCGAKMHRSSVSQEKGDGALVEAARNAMALARVFDESIRSIKAPDGLEPHPQEQRACGAQSFA